MEKFKFHQDELVSIWRRSTFEIEANSKEEAIGKIKSVDFNDDDLESIGEFVGSEFLFETEEILQPSEERHSTFEVEDPDTGSTIYTNNE